MADPFTTVEFSRSFGILAAPLSYSNLLSGPQSISPFLDWALSNFSTAISSIIMKRLLSWMKDLSKDLSGLLLIGESSLTG